MNEPQLDLTELVASQLRTIRDHVMRLFAVDCCRRVSQLLSDDWQDGIDIAELFATGRATHDELISKLRRLSKDFKEVIESDNGEIYAAKQAVLACLDPMSPFDPTMAASSASKSIGCYYDSEEAKWEEEAWQIAGFQALIAEYSHDNARTD